MRLRTMTEQDIPAGLELNTLSGWNQTTADWKRFLDYSPGGCFVMECDGKVVGTATTISYEGRFAWIGMVLVNSEFRNLGIGTQLLERAIEHLAKSKNQTMKLDATPQGKPLYKKLGFVEEYEIERWILKKPQGLLRLLNNKTFPSPTPAQLKEIFAKDKKFFGADRSFLLQSLFDEFPEFAVASWKRNTPVSYCFGRRGLFADHLGPWMARSSADAGTILGGFIAQSSRDTVIVDCLKSNTTASEIIKAHGFSFSRQLTRMFRGSNSHPGQPNSLCAILGPEFG